MRHRNHLRIIAVAGLLQFGISACGKKEPTAGTPALTMGAANAPAAEAVVVGAKGPLELTLRVYKTKIKSDKESLWYQVQLRNIGRKEILILDEPFLMPTSIEMHGSVGTALWVTGPDGKRLKPRLHLGGYGGGVLVPGSPSWPIQEDDKRDTATQQKVIDTMWADRAILRLREEYAQELERSGVSAKELDRKTAKFNEEHPFSDDNAEPRPGPHLMLQPGAAITTIPWTDRSAIDPAIKREFSEFVGYGYTKPGKYRIRARYDQRERGWVVEYDKKHGIPPKEDAVLVETPEIEFEVVP